MMTLLTDVLQGMEVIFNVSLALLKVSVLAEILHVLCFLLVRLAAF